MVLQNELADEQLKHFQDTYKEQVKPGGSREVVLSSNGVHDDNDLPEDEGGSHVPISDDDLDKDNDLQASAFLWSRQMN